ncbi:MULTISPECIES: maleylacetate reductase [unclassified Streptomyces]|uniref:maleylacetate reductase n=1 Tax=unclassified Streptomyces TaxID=2593676 RepID=UPI002DD9DE00|nr:MULTISPECIES: maleylacetate reductase [unclassified Streptomyces]WSC35224.1 maleylacetate reductase [Streptomyces sp. NBC_01763]WSC57502.1 maleylacetate reductase [Streptomyces sp. NBC_01761]WSF88606.1 maleylacetate reductase [Streptomyces sp. NBC_01744]WSJ54843.1 maleylacetate reductase [Streptomyces sp. NBC_01318]
MIEKEPSEVSVGRVDFVHQWPASRVVFGPGKISVAASEAARFGTRFAVIHDPTAQSAADRVASDARGGVCARIGEVAQHVPVQAVTEAVAIVREARAEVLICIGGGSATGLAKGVARELGLPLVAVPTTYAGSEMTSIWGHTEGGKKTTGRAETVRPRTVVYDPELTLDLPPAISVTSGVNAIAHCVEAMYAPESSPMTRVAAAEGIRSMSRALPGILDEPRDVGVRGFALRGAWLSGWSLEVSTTGLHHKLCHILGGLLDLPHSPLHTVLLPYAVAHIAPAAEAETRIVLESLGLTGPVTDAGGLIWEHHRLLGAPASLAEIGMREADVERTIAEASAALADRPLPPRPIGASGLRDVILTAFKGDRPAA